MDTVTIVYPSFLDNQKVSFLLPIGFEPVRCICSDCCFNNKICIEIG